MWFASDTIRPSSPPVESLPDSPADVVQVVAKTTRTVGPSDEIQLHLAATVQGVQLLLDSAGEASVLCATVDEVCGSVDVTSDAIAVSARYGVNADVELYLLLCCIASKVYQ